MIDPKQIDPSYKESEWLIQPIDPIQEDTPVRKFNTTKSVPRNTFALGSNPNYKNSYDYNKQKQKQTSESNKQWLVNWFRRGSVKTFISTRLESDVKRYHRDRCYYKSGQGGRGFKWGRRPDSCQLNSKISKQSLPRRRRQPRNPYEGENNSRERQRFGGRGYSGRVLNPPTKD